MIDGELPEACNEGECASAVTQLLRVREALIRQCERIDNLIKAAHAMRKISQGLFAAAAILTAAIAVAAGAGFIVGWVLAAVLAAILATLLLAAIAFHLLAGEWENKSVDAINLLFALRAEFERLIAGVRDNCSDECIECLDFTIPSCSVGGVSF